MTAGKQKRRKNRKKGKAHEKEGKEWISDLEIRKFEKEYKKEFKEWAVMKEHEIGSLAECMQFGKLVGMRKAFAIMLAARGYDESFPYGLCEKWELEWSVFHE